MDAFVVEDELLQDLLEVEGPELPVLTLLDEVELEEGLKDDELDGLNELDEEDRDPLNPEDDEPVDFASIGLINPKNKIIDAMQGNFIFN